MASEKPITSESLRGKIIDIHAHCGLAIKAYAAGEYPYCQSVEDLLYKRRVNNVDCGVVFPYNPDLFFDIGTAVRHGTLAPVADPLAPAPFVLENRLLFQEIYKYNSRHADRLLPFVMCDPGRNVAEQINALEALEAEYPVYGIKIVPVSTQSKVTTLLDQGRPIMEYATSRKLPVLFHVTVHPAEEYSQVSDTFEVIDAFPNIRYCLAHCVGFSSEYLQKAAKYDNVWVDTSALKIQVQATHENQDVMASEDERFPWDYSDHVSVMRSLVEKFPDTIVWGTDSPAYTYYCRRKQGEGQYFQFALQGTYEDEKAALDGLPAELKKKAGTENAIRYLFGE